MPTKDVPNKVDLPITPLQSTVDINVENNIVNNVDNNVEINAEKVQDERVDGKGSAKLKSRELAGKTNLQNIFIIFPENSSNFI